MEKSLALAMVRPELSEPGTALEMDILGTRRPAAAASVASGGQSD